jgi:hypothetical protein
MTELFDKRRGRHSKKPGRKTGLSLENKERVRQRHPIPSCLSALQGCHHDQHKPVNYSKNGGEDRGLVIEQAT